MCFPLNKIVFFFSSFSADILMLFHTNAHNYTRKRIHSPTPFLHAPAAFTHAGPRELTAPQCCRGFLTASPPPGRVTSRRCVVYSQS